MERDFKGVWIPKEIWLSNELTMQEKVFLAEINSLDNENGCFASNQYFAEFFGLSVSRTRNIIYSLIEKGLVKSTIFYKKGTKQIEKRVLKICSIPLWNKSSTPYGRNVPYPMAEKFLDINTINNTINNKDINPKVAEGLKNHRPSFKVFTKEVEDCYKSVYKLFPEKYQAKNKTEQEKHLDIIRLLITKDDFVPSDILAVVKWARESDFWAKNLMSIKALRTKGKDGVMKADRIKAQMETENKNSEILPNGWNKKDWEDRQWRMEQAKKRQEEEEAKLSSRPQENDEFKPVRRVSLNTNFKEQLRKIKELEKKRNNGN